MRVWKYLYLYYVLMRIILARAAINGPAYVIVECAFGENNYSAADETDR